MIDLKEYALITELHHTVVSVSHLVCGDSEPVLDLDRAVAWAGEHVCGQ